MKNLKGNLIWALVGLIVIVLGVLVIVGLNSEERVIGGDEDEHGCLISAGYSWNETKQKCVREWEERNKVYCKEGQRNVDVCITLYDPVCGYDFQGEKEMYSNSCLACQNENIEYWVKGEC
jgi:hypothetical protein